MLKKIVSAVLAALIICLCMSPALAAEIKPDIISIKLSSDVNGYSENDFEKFIEIKSDNVVFSSRHNPPISVSDYAGTTYNGKVKSGRSYYISYYLDAAEGFTLPEKLDDSNISIECGKGADVFSKQIVTGTIKDDDGTSTTVKGIMIQAKVTVDGNLIQRIIGLISDLYLKARAWSLY
jgi:hypothetical protein